ncbi:tetratricopeptide repeat protein [Balneolaceae bacterium YR4-1]|uniref:Tetratricopeptide repeat protein n=1 Tax=Halalkalibaculum roseum TaxID=2709311 RepID=A0A6M1SYL9_9BACT|nr:tetratricopeptide repeat protein [Halalkalibaculum roseum]NGP77408.1 tetratricopeptide repeat protein [Halalkalibaculum roseum]
MKHYSLLLALLLFFGCSSETKVEPKQNYQTISALGDTLYAPDLDPETEAQFTTNLQSARAQYEANPDDADAIIWFGRRTAYLGNYRKAVEIFSEGIEKHPEDARMYRHRGHRYITLREFDKAIEDLETAAELIKGTEDVVEPDGLPNTRNMPRSTLHTNTWYHLGLARYLSGSFDNAADAYRNCLEASTNDDMVVATSYWLYMTLKRAGHDGLAGEVLKPITQDMELLENESYHKLLLVFKGDFDEKSLLDNAATPLDNATIGYGIGNWHYVNGRTDRAEEIFREVYQSSNWAAFGYIAAEVDLARLEF